MTYFWLFLAYIALRLIWRWAFYEQRLRVSHVVRLIMEGFVYTMLAIVAIGIIGGHP